MGKKHEKNVKKNVSQEIKKVHVGKKIVVSVSQPEHSNYKKNKKKCIIEKKTGRFFF